MLKVGLLVRLIAKAGKEEEVASLLEAELSRAQQEVHTPVWFALRMSPREFGLLGAFADASARAEHLAGLGAAPLLANAAKLLSEPPRPELVEVMAAKLPGG